MKGGRRPKGRPGGARGKPGGTGVSEKQRLKEIRTTFGRVGEDALRLGLEAEELASNIPWIKRNFSDLVHVKDSKLLVKAVKLLEIEVNIRRALRKAEKGGSTNAEQIQTDLEKTQSAIEEVRQEVYEHVYGFRKEDL